MKEVNKSAKKLRPYISTKSTSESHAYSKKNNQKPFSYWLQKNNYYHTCVKRFYSFIVPPGSRVLHINCRNGYLLDAVKPSYGVGIDEDATSIADACQQYPAYEFYQSTLQDLDTAQQFDYIILSFATMEADDIQELLFHIHRFCHPGTRIIVESYSSLWEPILWLIQKLGLKKPMRFKNWMSQYDLANFLYLAGFDVVTDHKYMLLPFYIPIISALCNSILVHLPLIKRLCLHSCIVARSGLLMHSQDVTVSIIIPCRNEKGNIEDAVWRCPQMGAKTELIFVEGGSQDGTLQEIKRVAAAHIDKNISWFRQDGVGKGDAVRKGFAHASGDVLMILDADLTVPPEQLLKFFEALVIGKGEFINGSRLVYGMESSAMRFLNLLANFFFSQLFSWILGQRVKDTLCGTRVLWAKDYKRICAQRSFWGGNDPFGDFDLLFGASRLGLKIVDMPIHYKNRIYGKTNIRRFWHGCILLWMSVIAIKKVKLSR